MKKHVLTTTFSFFSWLLLVNGVIISAILIFPKPFPALADDQYDATAVVSGDLFYVGHNDIRLQTRRIYGFSRTHNFVKANLSFWRYKEGSSRDTAEKRPGDIEWHYDPDFPGGFVTLHWHDHFGNHEIGETYRYFIRGVFYFNPKPPNLNDYKPFQQVDEYEIQKTATPGRAWGNIVRDTVWNGKVEIIDTVSIPEGVALMLGSSAEIGRGDPYRKYIYVHGQLIADGAVFNDMGEIECRDSFVSIRNSTLNGTVTLRMIDDPPRPPEVIFQGNSGDSSGTLLFSTNRTSSMHIFGNDLPNYNVHLQNL